MTEAEYKAIDDMPASPEMDRAVLDLIGECKQSGCDESNVFHLVRRRSPSSDWNDAMYAAEKCHLFEAQTVADNGYAEGKTRQAYLLQRWGRFAIFEFLMHWPIPDGMRTDYPKPSTHHHHVADHESGPLCICRAILKLRSP